MKKAIVIAVVGTSKNPEKDTYTVPFVDCQPRYLARQKGMWVLTSTMAKRKDPEGEQEENDEIGHVIVRLFLTC